MKLRILYATYISTALIKQFKGGIEIIERKKDKLFSQMTS